MNTTVMGRVKSIHMIGWKPPPRNIVKMNADGACKENNLVSCGGVIIDAREHWLGGFVKTLGHFSAVMAKLWSVFEGLNLTKSLGCVVL